MFGVCANVVQCLHTSCLRVFYFLLWCTRMNGLLLQLRRSVRRRLRHIQSRAVTLCKSDMFGISSRWILLPYSLLFQPQCEQRDKFVVSQCSHDARHEVDLSLTYIVESIVYQSNQCRLICRVFPVRCKQIPHVQCKIPVVQ